VETFRQRVWQKQKNAEQDAARKAFDIFMNHASVESPVKPFIIPVFIPHAGCPINVFSAIRKLSPGPKPRRHPLRKSKHPFDRISNI